MDIAMNKSLFAGIVIGVVLGITFSPQIATALYSIPPTQAWDDIEVGTGGNTTQTGNNITSAISYTDKLYILTDGSINITVQEFP